MLNALANFVAGLPRLGRIFFKALSVSIATVFLISIEPFIQKYFENDPVWFLVIKIIVWILAILAFSFIGLAIEQISEVKLARERLRERAIAFAHERIDRWVIKSLADEKISYAGGTPAPNSTFGNLSHSARRLVEGLYETLESHFAGDLNSDRIEFEVTFMTKSFKDGGITIAAWASRMHRAPRSIINRPSNADLYKDTVTAQIYKMPRPQMVIIPDTNADPNYAEVYPGQKSHIQSSIVFPVLDDSNDLAGTIVCHCDRPDFFVESERKFWASLAEIFARRLALTQRRVASLVHQVGEPQLAPW